MNTKIKVKAKNLIELLKVLDKSDEILCTLDLDLNVSKTTIKLLNNYSEDWSFNDENIVLEPIPEDINYDSKTQEVTQKYKIEVCEDKTDDEPQGTTYYTSSLCVSDYNSLATLVESIFMLFKQSPNIKFESGLFYNTLEVEYNNIASKPVSIEHSLLAMIIETYYRDSKFQDALDDTINKLRGMWITKELENHPNTTSLTKILYGGKK